MARYSKPIHVRVTEEERERIEKRAAAAGLQFSEYVRAAATGELETSPDPDGPPGPGSPPSSAPGGTTSQESSGPGRAGPRSEPEAPIVGPAGPGDSAGSIPDPAETSPIAGQRTVQEVIEETDIGAEVQEAAELDDVAREHFLERRTRQLHGQGKTTRVARSLAEAEWRSRGSNDAA